MKLKELLFEIKDWEDRKKEVSGYFIDTRGLTHDLKGGDDAGRAGIGHLMDIGWIRVLIVRQMTGMRESDYRVYIDIPDVPSKMALGTLYRWLKDESFVYQDYVLRRDNMDGSFTKREATEYVRRVMTYDRNLTEANIPPTSYGYWIKDDGEFIPVASVKGSTHADIASQYFHGHALEAQRKAHLKGWIRTVNDKRMSIMYTAVMNPSKKALGSLHSLIRSDIDYSEYAFESPPAEFYSKREALQYVNKLKMEAPF